MSFLFDRLDDKIRNSRIAELEKQLEEARHAIKILSTENRQMRSERDKAQHASVSAWMNKYAKLEADFLAYRQKCNLDGTSLKKKRKPRHKLKLTEQWALQNSAAGGSIFNP